ncbi:hypothetical protein IFM89_030961 [Coptis chinensis]|uniref:Uncharacterized protein n=1 Tax=Coptis chinensis TaxID=261450 RepID=A0A835IZ88_9MAGN|nr:hypothetical protein IFM89_030961 [Coptis chinensis]
MVSQYSFGGIPFLFLGTNQIIFIIIILLYIFSGMAFASLSSETSLGVKVTEGNGKLPKVVLSFVDGSEAEIYLFGDCVTSWKVANGKDLLFVRPNAIFDGKKPISGGIPHCFPQFGPGAIKQKVRGRPIAPVSPALGPPILILIRLTKSFICIKALLALVCVVDAYFFRQHGFARNMNWSIADSKSVEGNPIITLELKYDPYSRSMWDFSFKALYKVNTFLLLQFIIQCGF